MVYRLNNQDKNFRQDFADLCALQRGQGDDVQAQVADIIADVRQNGDASLCTLTKKFDGLSLTPATMRVPQQTIDAADKDCDAETLAALDVAIARIRDFHARQKPADDHFTDAAGVVLGSRWQPVQAAGIYVPGGQASYPSSVLMNAIPAKIAGVSRLVMAVPGRQGKINPCVLAAAKRMDIDEIYSIGGAQAIAALAYGTESIAPVDVIVGPGNAYVAAAKRQVYGQVGIDMLAGPSEILVIADADNNPDWIAADLLSQAEHDANAQSILITDKADFAEQVLDCIATQLTSLPRRDIAAASWENFGAVIIVADIMTQAAALANELAPEHVELAVADPHKLAEQIHNAGAIFLGRYTPEAIGDYVAGPNHVLPTARAARYASGLSVLNFMKRSSLIECTADSLAEIGGAAVQLASAEALDGHARSIMIRLNKT